MSRSAGGAKAARKASNPLACARRAVFALVLFGSSAVACRTHEVADTTRAAPRSASPSAATSQGSTAAPVPPFIVGWKSTKDLRYAETGLAVAAFDPGSACKDILVANGNDVAPEPMALFLNRIPENPASGTRAFDNARTYPDWFSSDTAYATGLAVGRIDADGLLDAVAGVITRHPFANAEIAAAELGGFKVYRGEPCTAADGDRCRNAALGSKVRPMPSARAVQEVTGDLAVLAVALGDANGDGRLDLAVAGYSVSTKPVPLSAIHGGDVPNGEVRIYYNDGSAFSKVPDWKVSGDFHAASVTFADVDQDGSMDLVVGADRPYVYFGDARGPSISTEWGWRGDVADPGAAGRTAVVVDVTAGWREQPGKNGAAGLVVASGVGCPLSGQAPSACHGHVYVHAPSRGARESKSVFESRWVGSAGHVKIADFDGDGAADLVTGAFWSVPADPCSCRGGQCAAFGSPVRVFRQLTRGSREPAPGAPCEANGATCYDESYFADGCMVSEGIAVADLLGRSVRDGTAEFDADPTARRRVFTLPKLNVEDVTRVTLVDSHGERELAPGEYASIPGGDWVGLRRPLAAGEKLRVTYRYALLPGFVVADWSSENGVVSYERRGASGPTCGQPRPHSEVIKP